MILVFNLNGDPRHALGVLLLCVLCNIGFDLLTDRQGRLVWLELAASVLGLAVTGVFLAAVLTTFLRPGGNARWQHFVANTFAGRAAAPVGGGVGQRRQTAEQRQQRWHKIVEAVSRLPTDTLATEQELQQLTAHQLKERLTGAGGSCDGCLEKAELVRALLEVGGSSGTSCCICCDDYVSGDVLRILPCKHRFHIECVDKWFMSATDYTRPPACPICNAELL